MTPVTGNALRLEAELAALRRRHGVELRPVSIPLAAPTDGPMILSGYAAHTDIDLSRMRFAPRAFQLPAEPVPLLWRHDYADVAGTVDRLSYDAQGNLKVIATAEHPLARRAGAFSVGCTPLSYVLKDVDDPERFHALVTSVEVNEVSLVLTPANPKALVKLRYKDAFGPYVRTMNEQYALLGRAFALLTQEAELIGKVLAKQAKASHAKHLEHGSMTNINPPAAPRIYRRPRPSQFSQLAAALKEM